MAPSAMSGSFHPADRIVIPVEGTDREYVVQQWAAELAAALGVPVHGLHVTSGDEEEIHDEHFSFLQTACEKWGVELTHRVASRDNVAAEILDELGTRDLVVIGTRQLGGSQDYHVGSVAAELVRNAPCPVQIVRLEGP